jgi:hypothetical protein
MTDRQALLLDVGQDVILTCWKPNHKLRGRVWLATSMKWYEPEERMRPHVKVEVLEPPPDFGSRLWEGIPDWVEFAEEAQNGL